MGSWGRAFLRERRACAKPLGVLEEWTKACVAGNVVDKERVGQSQHWGVGRG